MLPLSAAPVIICPLGRKPRIKEINVMCVECNFVVDTGHSGVHYDLDPENRGVTLHSRTILTRGVTVLCRQNTENCGGHKNC